MPLGQPQSFRLIDESLIDTFHVIIPLTTADFVLIPRTLVAPGSLFVFEYEFVQNSGSPTGISIAAGIDGAAGADIITVGSTSDSLFKLSGTLVVTGPTAPYLANYFLELRDSVQDLMNTVGSFVAGDNIIEPVLRLVNGGGNDLDVAVTGWFAQLELV